MPVVSNPTAGDVHINRTLTTFSQLYIQENDMYVSTTASPNQPVAMQSDLYRTWSRADFFRDEAKVRADGTETAGGSFTQSTDQYFANVWGIHKDVTDRQRANSDPDINLDRLAALYVTQQEMTRREVLFAGTFMQSGVWSATVNVDYRSASATSPIVDITNRKRAIHGATGKIPNKAIFGRQAYDTVINNDDVLARIVGGATTVQPAQVRQQLLAQLLGIDRIFIMDAVVNTAVEGATEATGFIGADDILLYHAPDSLALETPSAMGQFSWSGFTGATSNGIRIKRFRMENLASDRVEAEMAFDYRITSPELGVFLTTVSAA